MPIKCHTCPRSANGTHDNWIYSPKQLYNISVLAWPCVFLIGSLGLPLSHFYFSAFLNYEILQTRWKKNIDTNPCPAQMWWNSTQCEESRQDSNPSSEMVSWVEPAGAPEERSDADCEDLEPSSSSASGLKLSITYVLCASILTVSPSDFPYLFSLSLWRASSSRLRDSSLSALIPGQCPLVSGHLVSSKHRWLPVFL